MAKPIIETLDDNYCRLSDNARNLTGQQFNNWLVLGYKGNQCWLCECQCEKHTKKIIRAYDLIKEISKSCGCTKKVRGSIHNYVGNTFKDVTIIKSVGRGRYLGRCKCGVEKLISGNDIKRGRAITCNHFKQDEYNRYIGKKFGELEVVEVNGAKATCKCSCGNTTEYYISALVQGTIKSCGCIRDRKSQLLVGKKFGYLTIEKYITDMTFCSCIEEEIGNYIESKGIHIERHNKYILNGQELDIYIPDKRIEIEFNGYYWHSTIHKDTYYHQNKTITCAKQGIQLIHIFEYEWKK